MTEVLPYQLSPSGCVFVPRMASRTGGVTLTGSEFIVASDAGFWTATLQFPVHGEARVLAYRALHAALGGMAGEVLVPCFTHFRPHDLNGRMIPSGAASDIGGGSMLDLGGLGVQEAPIMWTAEPAPRRATQLTISHPNVQSIRPGHYFGIGERLYLVAKQWQIEAEVPVTISGRIAYGTTGLDYGAPNDMVYGPREVAIEGSNKSVIQFWPPLREEVAGGAPLILGRPVCRMRLASDDTGTLDMGLGILGNPSIDFKEVG